MEYLVLAIGICILLPSDGACNRVDPLVQGLMVITWTDFFYP